MTNLIDVDGNTIAPDQRAAALLGQWSEYMEKDIPPIPTTIEPLDKEIEGFWGLSVIGGGPGSGKSALAIQAAAQYALNGGPVFYLSFEEGKAGFFGKIFQQITGYRRSEQRKRIRSNQELLKALKAMIDKMPNLRICEMPKIGQGFNFEQLKEDILALQEITKKTAFIVVDSLHYTPLPIEYNNLDGKRKIDTALSIFTDIQQSTDAAILMISHQTKYEAKSKESDLMSYSGSGTISYAVDIAFQITRQEDQPPNERTLEVAKNRGGVLFQGPDSIKLKFNLTHQKLTAQ